MSPDVAATCGFRAGDRKCSSPIHGAYNYCEAHLFDITAENLFQIVVALATSKLMVPAEAVTYEADFLKDLGADSLDLTELIMDCEEVLDISIPEHDKNELRTVESTIEYLATRFAKEENFVLSIEPFATHLSRIASIDRKNLPNREAEAYRLLKSKILADYYVALGHNFEAIRQAIESATAGQQIRYLTFIPEIGARRRVSVVHIMVLTNTLFVNLDLERLKITSIQVPLRDLTLRPEYQYGQDGKIRSISVNYEVRNHAAVGSGNYEFVNELGIEGAKNFLRKYHIFKERFAR